MLEGLINFFETAPLEDVKEKLKQYNVKFTSDENDEIEKRYDIITKTISTTRVGEFNFRAIDPKKKKLINTEKIYLNFDKFNDSNNINLSYNKCMIGYEESGREVAA